MSSIPQLEYTFLRESLEADNMSNKRRDSVGGDQEAVCNDRMPRNRERRWVRGDVRRT